VADESRTPFGAVIAIGGSAGAIEVITQIVSGLPPDLPAPVLVAVHIAPTSSALPEILERRASMLVKRPVNGEALEAGRIYVAPPDQHLTVANGRVVLDREPRENGHRPAVDPLLRSVARDYGRAGVGVIVSGARDDGSAGLIHIKHAGGVALVQDPEESLYDGMPRNAMRTTQVDGVYRTREIAQRLVDLSHRPMSVGSEPSHSAGAEAGRERAPGTGTRFTCPDCGGVLFEQREGGLERFACSVGHVYSPEALDAHQEHELEGALWAAVRSLEDRSTLLRRLAARALANEQQRVAENFEGRARDSDRRAQTIRRVITQPPGEEGVA
jgi:two-component system, chemotaxis family, protein-glutamate methylesterase/glutaminase